MALLVESAKRAMDCLSLAQQFDNADQNQWVGWVENVIAHFDYTKLYYPPFFWGGDGLGAAEMWVRNLVKGTGMFGYWLQTSLAR